MHLNNRLITIDHKDQNIEVMVRKSHLAKNIIIHVNQHKGIELVVPKRASMKQAIKFLETQQRWIIQKYLELNTVEKIKFEIGAKIPIQGKEHKILYSGKLRGITKITNDSIVVSGLIEHIPRKVKDFLISKAKTQITFQADLMTKNLGVKYNKITIRDTSSRWGSCSNSRNLSFSWRLILAPPFVLEYVAAHEVAHILQMNHSQKFWEIVSNIYPDYKIGKNWLKKNGNQLHLYG